MLPASAPPGWPNPCRCAAPAAGARVRARLAIAPMARGAHVLLLLLTHLSGVRGVDGGGNAAYIVQEASVQYQQTDLYDGLPSDLLGRLDEILDGRLAPSSLRSIESALKYWDEVRHIHGWSRVIESNSPARGAQLVAFILYMVDDSDLAWGSIQNYIWAFCTWNVMQRQLDPRRGVARYSEFMSAIKVLAFEVGEPRREIPLALLEKVASAVHANCFWQVNAFFLLLIMYFTFSRSECPCPKTYTGRECFDDKQHWQVRDFDIRALSTGAYALFVRFKKVKQDPRIQRPEVRGDGGAPGTAREGGSDWSVVGDIPGHVLSPFVWYRRLMQFYPNGRDKTDPMFMDSNRKRPYLYSTALTDVKRLIALVQPDDTNYGLHGARVGGYNCSVKVNGEELTAAHGLWRSRAHTRYARWGDPVAAAIPANMVGAKSPYEVEEEEGGDGRQLSAARAAPRKKKSPGRRTKRSTGQEQQADDAEVSAGVKAPPEWSQDDDGLWVPPKRLADLGAEAQQSLDKAWALHRQLSRLASD